MGDYAHVRPATPGGQRTGASSVSYEDVQPSSVGYAKAGPARDCSGCGVNIARALAITGIVVGLLLVAYLLLSAAGFLPVIMTGLAFVGGLVGGTLLASLSAAALAGLRKAPKKPEYEVLRSEDMISRSSDFRSGDPEGYQPYSPAQGSSGSDGWIATTGLSSAQQHHHG